MFKLSEKESLSFTNIVKNQSDVLPVKDFTLNKYYDLCKDALIGASRALNDTDKESSFSTEDLLGIENFSSIEATKRFMDGRSIFNSHGYTMWQGKNIILSEINPDSPNEFRSWVTTASYGGHPYELHYVSTLSPYYPDKDVNSCYIILGNYRLWLPYALYAYINLREQQHSVLFAVCNEVDKKSGNYDKRYHHRWQYRDQVNRYLTKYKLRKNIEIKIE